MARDVRATTTNLNCGGWTPLSLSGGKELMGAWGVAEIQSAVEPAQSKAGRSFVQTELLEQRRVARVFDYIRHEGIGFPHRRIQVAALDPAIQPNESLAHFPETQMIERRIVCHEKALSGEGVQLFYHLARVIEPSGAGIGKTEVAEAVRSGAARFARLVHCFRTPCDESQSRPSGPRTGKPDA